MPHLVCSAVQIVNRILYTLWYPAQGFGSGLIFTGSGSVIFSRPDPEPDPSVIFFFHIFLKVFLENFLENRIQTKAPDPTGFGTETLRLKPRTDGKRIVSQKDCRRIGNGWQKDNRRTNSIIYSLTSFYYPFASRLLSFCKSWKERVFVILYFMWLICLSLVNKKYI